MRRPQCHVCSLLVAFSNSCFYGTHFLLSYFFTQYPRAYDTGIVVQVLVTV